MSESNDVWSKVVESEKDDTKNQDSEGVEDNLNESESNDDSENQESDLQNKESDKESDQEEHSEKKEEEDKNTVDNESSEDSGDDVENKKSKLSELSDGKFDNEESLYSAYKDLSESQKESPYASDYIKELNDLESKGVRVTPDLIYKLSHNWGEMDISNPKDAYTLVREKHRLENSDLTDEEIDFEISEKYSYNEDERRAQLDREGLDDDDIESTIKNEKNRVNKRLQIEAKRSKPLLEEYRSKLMRADDKPKLDMNEFSKQINETVNGIDNIEFSVSDEEFNLGVSKELKTEASELVIDMVNNPTKFWDKLGGSKGFMQMYMQSKLQGKMGEEIAKRMTSKATEDMVRKATNQKSHSIESSSTSNKEVEDAKSWAKAYAGAR